MTKKDSFSFLLALGIVISISLIYKDHLSKKEVVQRENSNKIELPENSFKSKLGPAKEELIFSIPKEADLGYACPGGIICSEGKVDGVESRYWWFAVSQDYTHYAYYLISGEDKYIVLDGKPAEESFDYVYFMQFSPDGKDFVYHAYSSKDRWTYLVFNGKKIPIYPGREGFPQAANGVSEAFSADSQHFAYAKVEREKPNLMQIILDGKEINVVEAEDIRFRFNEANELEYITTVPNHKRNRYDKANYKEFYYKNDKLVSESDLDEFNSFIGVSQESPASWVEVKDKTVLINGKTLAAYSNYNPEVYVSNLVLDEKNFNLTYLVWENSVPKRERVSLNGYDSQDEYNYIKGVRFSEDGKSLVYVGRRGRNIYKVAHEIIQ